MFMFDRFAKKKLDEFVFLGNRLQVSYAPQFESLSDTKDKLEGRRREVLARLNRTFSCIVGMDLTTVSVRHAIGTFSMFLK